MIRQPFIGVALAGAAAFLSTPASASAEPHPAVALAKVATTPAVAVSPEAAPFSRTDDFSRMLTDAELRGARGGEGVIVTNQTLTAITSGNSLLGGYTAGAVNLSDNALSSFNGVGNLLINTGAQNNLQTGMNLTINVRQ